MQRSSAHLLEREAYYQKYDSEGANLFTKCYWSVMDDVYEVGEMERDRSVAPTAENIAAAFEILVKKHTDNGHEPYTYGTVVNQFADLTRVWRVCYPSFPLPKREDEVCRRLLLLRREGACLLSLGEPFLHSHFAFGSCYMSRSLACTSSLASVALDYRRSSAYLFRPS